MIYIDSDFKCHTSAADGRMQVDTDAFDGKCDTYIEGYRFIPSGQTWTRADGTVFVGEMIAPWKPWAELDASDHRRTQKRHPCENRGNESQRRRGTAERAG